MWWVSQYTQNPQPKKRGGGLSRLQSKLSTYSKLRWLCGNLFQNNKTQYFGIESDIQILARKPDMFVVIKNRFFFFVRQQSKIKRKWNAQKIFVICERKDEFEEEQRDSCVNNLCNAWKNPKRKNWKKFWST